MAQILTSATQNGDSSIVTRRQRATLIITGTWDTATATLKVSPDNGTTWVDVPDGAFTDDTVKIVDNETDPPNASTFKLTLSSVGASTSLSAWL